MMPHSTYSPEKFNRFVKKFWARVQILDDPDACWEWQAGRMPSGYGRVCYQSKGEYAHRIARMLADGDKEPSPEFDTLHSCDNPACCNPKHLRLGTHQQNMQEREDRHRRDPEKRISAEVQQESIRLYRTGLPATIVGELVGLPSSSVYRILHNHGVSVARQLIGYGEKRDMAAARARTVKKGGA